MARILKAYEVMRPDEIIDFMNDWDQERDAREALDYDDPESWLYAASQGWV